MLDNYALVPVSSWSSFENMNIVQKELKINQFNNNKRSMKDFLTKSSQFLDSKLMELRDIALLFENVFKFEMGSIIFVIPIGW